MERPQRRRQGSRSGSGYESAAGVEGDGSEHGWDGERAGRHVYARHQGPAVQSKSAYPSTEAQVKPTRAQSMPALSLLPSAEIPTARKAKKHAQPKSMEYIEDDADEEAHPTEPNTQPMPTPSTAPLETWMDQLGSISLKDKTPIQQIPQCERCDADGQDCWRMEGLRACMYCRIQKKSACSLTGQVKRKTGPKSSGVKNATSKMASMRQGTGGTEGKAKGTVVEASTSDRTVVPRPAGSKRASSRTPPAAAAPADPSQAHSSTAHSSMATSTTIRIRRPAPAPDTTNYVANKESSCNSQNPSMANQSKADSNNLLGGGQPMSVDPLVCPPAMPNEIRCTCFTFQLYHYTEFTHRSGAIFIGTPHGSTLNFKIATANVLWR